ncbi:hypothetical protein C1645_826945 [Glomus cerebriforme]|uniref:Uncharacterized protein n=1 Tax=Glomus cerebriforme TaxID=658196 RepID=A0A397STZ6_9GLOM|nr:hypothetical protein C1645_826945 [Glomus cerebriforme]
MGWVRRIVLPLTLDGLKSEAHSRRLNGDTAGIIVGEAEITTQVFGLSTWMGALNVLGKVLLSLFFTYWWWFKKFMPPFEQRT